jgi:capsular exopolysaccharide synthesis family protein
LALGLGMGLLLGIAIALGREFLDRSIHTRSEAQLATGVSVLGVIPRMPESKGAAVTRRSESSSELQPAAEAYERLQTNIAYALPDRAVRTIVITSPLPGDGKTTTATNLALSIARRGSRVMLIDADLRRGAIDGVFGAPREPGLTDVLAGFTTLERALQAVDLDDGVLHYLTSGAPPAFPKGVIASDRMRVLLDRLARAYDVVVIDSPPLNVVVDAAELARSADAVLVVARAGITAPQALAYTVEQLRNVGALTLGTVLNDVDIQRDVTYDHAYSYYGLRDARYYASAR